MKKTLLFITLLLSYSFAHAANEIDSLLNVLDKTIAERQVYESEKQAQINNLKKQLQNASTNEQCYNIYGKLFEEYKNYQMDSALFIANKRISIANSLNNKKYITIANLNLGEVMSITGMYKEALDILNDQNPKSFDDEETSYYYHLYHSLYTLMSEYSISEKEKSHYNELTQLYKDSILSNIPPDNFGYPLVKSMKLLSLGEYDEALKYANNCYQSFIANNNNTAIITYIISDIYYHKGNREEEKRYLALSAISDIGAGVKEYISLRKLAILLYEDGDIDRAYSYMKCSMEDAIFCNARLRTLEISHMLPIINTTYDLKMKQEKSKLISLLVIISIMACVLIGAVIYIYKQLKTLSRIRRSLKEINENLKSANNDLNNINNKLSESNHVKEEYIGYVFSICSAYIDKLEDFRKKTNRKLKAGQIDELYKITSSSSLVNDELKDFYRNFDTIFLNLYPNYVEEFNSLLTENEQIIPKDGDLLTPELRIFALVRLGVNDSVKIADFLHYSPQTVYNYRLKVRNKAIVSKEDFSVAVSQIGKIKDN